MGSPLPAMHDTLLILCHARAPTANLIDLSSLFFLDGDDDEMRSIIPPSERAAAIQVTTSRDLHI